MRSEFIVHVHSVCGSRSPRWTCQAQATPKLWWHSHVQCRGVMCAPASPALPSWPTCTTGHSPEVGVHSGHRLTSDPGGNPSLLASRPHPTIQGPAASKGGARAQDGAGPSGVPARSLTCTCRYTHTYTGTEAHAHTHARLLYATFGEDYEGKGGVYPLCLWVIDRRDSCEYMCEAVCECECVCIGVSMWGTPWFPENKA